MRTLAGDLIRRARGYGVQVALHENRLRLTAPRKPPGDLLAEPRRHKAEIIAFLSHRAGRDCFTGRQH